MKMHDQPQNMDLNKIRLSVQVFIVGAILSITFFLMFVDALKTYTSSITILVSAKSEIAAGQQPQIIANILEFPRTLAFYDRLLKYNKDVRDVAATQNQDRRKKTWNSMLSVTRVGENSSILKISITAGQAADADLLAQKTVRNLFDVTAAYYDIKNDVDLRIVDGPISRTAVALWYWTAPLSIVLGFLIAFFLQYVMLRNKQALLKTDCSAEEKSFFDFKKGSRMPSAKKIESLEELYAAEQAEAPFRPQAKSLVAEITPQIQEMKKLTKMIEPDKYPNFPEMPQTPRAGAPDNLPIAGGDFLHQSEPEDARPDVEKQNDDILVEEKKPTIHPEPTAEQLKERLNKLLRGEL
jgi:hypothetical protein